MLSHTPGRCRRVLLHTRGISARWWATFRPLQASLLAILPVLGILHFAALWVWGWHLPGLLAKGYPGYFYLDLWPQALLPAMVGVALAAGIRAA